MCRGWNIVDDCGVLIEEIAAESGPVVKAIPLEVTHIALENVLIPPLAVETHSDSNI